MNSRCEVCLEQKEDYEKASYSVPNLFGPGLNWVGKCCVDCGLAFLQDGEDGLLRRFLQAREKEQRREREEKNSTWHHDIT